MFFVPSDVDRRLASERPIVIMARGHSGTRVLAQAIELLGVRMGGGADKASNDVGDDRFAQAIKDIARRTLHLPPHVRPDRDELRLFRRRAYRYLRRLGSAPGGWGWKLPETYMIGNYVRATFPGAQLIHMIRDGRDVAFKYHRTDRPDQRLGKRLLDHLGVLDEPHHLQAARSWEYQVQRFARFQQRSGAAVHRVTFEQLCTEPVRAMEGVAELLGRELTDETRAFLEKQVNPRKVGEYRRRPPEMVADIEHAIGRTLRAEGYETTTAPSRQGVSPRLPLVRD